MEEKGKGEEEDRWGRILYMIPERFHGQCRGLINATYRNTYERWCNERPLIIGPMGHICFFSSLPADAIGIHRSLLTHATTTLRFLDTRSFVWHYMEGAMPLYRLHRDLAQHLKQKKLIDLGSEDDVLI